MPDIDDDTTFAVRDQVIAEEIDGDLVVLDLEADVYFSLNKVGGIVWKGVQAGRRFAAIVDEIIEVYDIDRGRAASDARAFVERALDHNLFEVE